MRSLTEIDPLNSTVTVRLTKYAMGSACSRTLEVSFPKSLEATIIPLSGTVEKNLPGLIQMYKPAGLAQGCGCIITFRLKDAVDPDGKMEPLISKIHCYTAFDKNIWNNEVGMPKRSDGTAVTDQNDLNLQIKCSSADPTPQGNVKDWKHACHLSVKLSFKPV